MFPSRNPLCRLIHRFRQGVTTVRRAAQLCGLVLLASMEDERENDVLTRVKILEETMSTQQEQVDALNSKIAQLEDEVTAEIEQGKQARTLIADLRQQIANGVQPVDLQPTIDKLDTLLARVPTIIEDDETPGDSDSAPADETHAEGDGQVPTVDEFLSDTGPVAPEQAEIGSTPGEDATGEPLAVEPTTGL
jgi:seryl-tRNA synthetase